jgi:hypothetical protein
MSATLRGNNGGSHLRYEDLLQRSPAFRSLGSSERRDVSQALAKVERFLDDLPASPVARQLAPDLSALRAGNPSAAPPPSAGPQPPSAGPAPGGAAPTPAGGGGAVGRVGDVARATLSAIDFPAFVASLIQGTFQAIVDSSIQQMEAYAELLKSAAGTVDRFMQDKVSDGMARDYLAEQHGNVFMRDTSQGPPRLRVSDGNASAQLPSFLKDMGFESPTDIDDDALETVVIPSTRRHLAESRQRTLATMVLMGINRVVVDDGEITAKLQFHIDASEAMQMRFDQTKTTAGNMSGNAGRSPFGAQAVMVNTTSLNAQTDINVRADLTGHVRVKFRSETFPLERFADSAAIQFINSNARVPQEAPAAAAPAPAGAVAGPAPTLAPAPPSPVPNPPAIPAAPVAPPPAASAGWVAEDQWAPGE